MRMWRWIAITLLGATVCSPAVATAADEATPGQTLPGPACTGVAATPDPDAQGAILRLVNGARAQAGVPRLGLSGLLTTFAVRHSRQMASDDQLAHSMVDGRLAFAPLTKAAGETLAIVGTPLEAVQGWLGSPHHRAALLSRTYRFAGVGAVRNCGGELIVTAEFLGA